MSEFKGSQTEKNVLAAFAGESQARNRYTYFAKQAKKEGFIQISEIFEKTADQERAHAKRFFKLLKGGDVEITAKYPAGVIGTTLENLKASSEGEHHEWSELYPSFAKVAREEGFETVALVFEHISVAEKLHERRYKSLMENIEKGLVFKKEEPVKWYCLKCGYVHEGTDAPKGCPACAHPQAYFEVLAENW